MAISLTTSPVVNGAGTTIDVAVGFDNTSTIYYPTATILQGETLVGPGNPLNVIDNAGSVLLAEILAATEAAVTIAAGQSVGIAGALPAGTNNLGTVAITGGGIAGTVTLAAGAAQVGSVAVSNAVALAAGTANIGTVAVAGGGLAGTVTLAAGVANVGTVEVGGTATVTGSVTLAGTSPVSGTVDIATGQSVAITGTATVIPAALTPVVSASAAVASLVLKASAGTVFAFHVENATATGGYVILYNATAAPSPGALTPADVLWFQDLPASGYADWSASPAAIAASIGAVVLISSAATPFTYTTGVVTGAICGMAQ